jgi:glycerol uptake facilitator-like aquaporin
MRKYMTEFIGTFGLVFTVGCAVMVRSRSARC